ncbi:hypothetical protein TWF694_002291 [Orbilia ellipsospora]|uniref:Uncharacterized protein n=1 Tax=Orbilia ellipsospora TaxID=2528407 RepID=A0AAV9X1I1_9PEZI
MNNKIQTTSHEAIKGAPGIMVPNAEMQEEFHKQNVQNEEAAARMKAEKESKGDSSKKPDAKESKSD